MKPLHILLLHGPNLNLLGKREPRHYGQQSLADINQQMMQLAKQEQVQLQHFQSNHEGALIDRIHAAGDAGIDGIVFNPAAYTHRSIALRDALLGVGIPFIETHLSNVHAREPFRHESMLADIAIGVIAGFGAHSYSLALQGLCHHLRLARS